VTQTPRGRQRPVTHVQKKGLMSLRGGWRRLKKKHQPRLEHSVATCPKEEPSTIVFKDLEKLETSFLKNLKFGLFNMNRFKWRLADSKSTSNSIQPLF
jgi:hypothetical protein